MFVSTGSTPNNFNFKSTFSKWNNFKVCKSVHHHTIPINQPTRSNNFPMKDLEYSVNNTAVLLTEYSRSFIVY